MTRVLLISEYINPPYDEGIKKSVFNLFEELDKHYDLHVICRFGFKKENIEIIDTNALYLSSVVYSAIKKFKPDCLIYFPFQSSTFASYIRHKVLSYFAGTHRNILIALQPKPIKKWQFSLIPKLDRTIGLTPSLELYKQWNTLSLKQYLVPLYTDLETFTPLKDRARKNELRTKYGIRQDVFVISHMGHLNEGRNLRTLIPLQNENNQVVVVASSSTPKDALGPANLKGDLLEAGIKIIDQSLDRIQEIYQMSDLYIFPVVDQNSSIGLPLSIMEARACCIQVVCTNYGSVKKYFDDDGGGITYAEPEKFNYAVEQIKEIHKGLIPSKNIEKINSMLYDRIHQIIKE